jgi:hypothetical protein
MMGLIEAIKHLREDLRAEAIFTELSLSRAVDKADLRIRMDSLFKRRYRRDLLKLEYSREEHPLLIGTISRDGLYDGLPEGLFHPPPKKRSAFRTMGEKLDIFKKQSKEELEARRFFAPFEQGFFDSRLSLFELEQAPLSSFAEYLLAPEVLACCDAAGPVAKDALFTIFPHIAVWRGNAEASAWACSYVLQVPIAIAEGKEDMLEAHPSQPLLGDCTLGLDMCTWGKAPSGLPCYEVRIGPLTCGQLPDFLEGGSQYRLLDVLLDMLLPATHGRRMIPVVKEEEANFILADKEEDTGFGYLAFSSVLPLKESAL